MDRDGQRFEPVVGRMVLGGPGESQPAKSERSSDPSAGGCAEPQVLFNGAGLYCLGCHASAINNQGTYSSTAFLNADSVHSAGASLPPMQDDMHQRFDMTGGHRSAPAPMFASRIPSSVFNNLRPLSQASSVPAWSRSSWTMWFRPPVRRRPTGVRHLGSMRRAVTMRPARC